MKKAIQAEKKKISEISSRKAKVGYIWDYYKLWIIGIVFAIGFIIFCIHQYFFTIKDNWFYITFANTYAEIGDKSDLWQGYVDYTGYDLSEKNVEFNNTSYFDYLENVTGNTYFESFVSYEEAGTLDAITMEDDSLTALGETGRLLDLDSPECESIKEKYGDRFLYCQPNDEDYGDQQVAVGIDISDSILMTKYNIYADSCALGIGANSQNLEAVEAFLDYIYEEEE